MGEPGRLSTAGSVTGSISTRLRSRDCTWGRVGCLTRYMYGQLAHIVDGPVADPVAWGALTLALGGAAFAMWLSVQHHLVRYGGFNGRSARTGFGAALALAMVLVATPTSADGQETHTPAGLPDLVSEPPIIWFNKVVTNDDDSRMLVMAFDGYIHNVGEGVLDLAGNPQIPGDVKQRWFDGEQWNEVAEPLVIYETNDGHNHFHLINASEYALWNEARTEEIGESAKVGFCLLDTEQFDTRYDSLYDIDAYDYCEQNRPESTDLHMGITPGWVDTYDANTTLQWVDTSNIAPGRYWISAITDPEDQIVESDEDNNALTFSRNKFAVDGWVARELPIQSSAEPIALKADGYGTTGPPAWQITQWPRNGSLSVPAGVDFFDGLVSYTPDEGFDGVDSFAYTVTDLHSIWPLEPAETSVSVDAAAWLGSDPVQSTTESGSITLLPQRIDAEIYTRVELEALGFEGSASALQPIEWFSSGLPDGLAIDRESGVIAGTPTFDNEGIARVVAAVDGLEVAETTVAWTVTDPGLSGRPSLNDVGDFTSPRNTRINRHLGRGTQGAVYTATGLPGGVRMVENVPLVSGDPAESGVFDVEITETVDGEVTATTSFTWTIRPGIVPEFPL